jgi:hypothetical protein
MFNFWILRRKKEVVCVLWCLFKMIIVHAFLAATFCHLHSTVPLLDQNKTILTRNHSTDLFTSPILAAHEKLESMGAKVITVDPRPSQDRNAHSGLNLPDIDMFFYMNAATALLQLSKTMGQVTRQKFPAH